MFLNCLNLKLHSIFEKKSEKEVPLWTPQTAGRHGKQYIFSITNLWRYIISTL